MIKINLIGDMLVGEEEAEDEVGEIRGTACLEGDEWIKAFEGGDLDEKKEEGRLLSVADKSSKDFLDNDYRITPMSLSARVAVAESRGRSLTEEDLVALSMEAEKERRLFELKAEEKLRNRGLYDRERWNKRMARTNSLFFEDIPSQKETDNMREKACLFRDKLENIKEGVNIETIEDLKAEIKSEINNGIDYKNIYWKKVEKLCNDYDETLSPEGKEIREKEKRYSSEQQQMFMDDIKKNHFPAEDHGLDKKLDQILPDGKQEEGLLRDIKYLEGRLEFHKENKDDHRINGTEKVLRCKKYLLSLYQDDEIDPEFLNREREDLGEALEYSGPAGKLYLQHKSRSALKKECLEFIAQLMPHLV